MIVIKGDWRTKSDEVFKAQYSDFVFINCDCDIEPLIELLKTQPLDPSYERFGNFIKNDPCIGVTNPKWNYATKAEPQWIDGRRIFDVNGVVLIHGRFFRYSYCFCIYTNNMVLIKRLTDSIRNNQKSKEYLNLKKQEVNNVRNIFLDREQSN